MIPKKAGIPRFPSNPPRPVPTLKENLGMLSPEAKPGWNLQELGAARSQISRFPVDFWPFGIKFLGLMLLAVPAPVIPGFFPQENWDNLKLPVVIKG